MNFKDLKGKKIQKDVSRYLIKWGKKSRSNLQTTTKFQLEPYWKRHIVYEEFPCAGTRLSLDFVNLTLRVAVEVQGQQHSQFVPFFHNGDEFAFGNQLERDNDKLIWCNLNRIHLVEVHPSDLPLTTKFLQENKLK